MIRLRLRRQNPAYRSAFFYNIFSKLEFLYSLMFMKLNLVEIPRVKSISKEDFYKNYVKKQKPLVIGGFTAY